jgi:hypothetical protein
MANAAYTRNQRCYPVIEAAWGTAVAPAGTDCCLITSLATQAAQAEIPRPDKTGSLGEIVGIPGRRSATWTAAMSTAGSGVAGTPPDSHAFLQAGFGKAVAIAAGVSATYALDDLIYSMSVWHYNAPASVCQYVAIGAIVNQMRFAIGGDVPMLEVSGPALWVYDSDQQADGTTDAIAKGGLAGALPAEPTPTTNGKPPAGFTGVITLDGNTYGTMRTASITLGVAKDLPMDTFNSYYGTNPAPGMRVITCDFGLYDDDSAQLKSFSQKGKSVLKPLVNLSFQWGTVPGNIWTLNLKNVMLPVPTVDYGATRRALTFTGCRAHDTSIGSKDAVTLVLT